MLSTALEPISIVELANNAHVLFENRDPDTGRPKPFVAYGKRGSAKTSFIESVVAKNLEKHTGKPVHVITEVPSTRDPLDLRGTPFPTPRKDADGKNLRPANRFTMPDLMLRMQEINESEGGAENCTIMLLFDEFGQADAATQKALAPVFHPGVLGEEPLPPNVWVVGTSNFKDEGAGVQRSLSHLANRICHYNVYLPADDFVSYGAKHGLPAAGLWYVQNNKGLFESFDPAQNTQDVTCTYRSFTFAMGAISAVKKARGITDEKHVPDDTFTKRTVEGYIGREAAANFFAVVPYIGKVPDISQVMRDPEGTEVPPEMHLQFLMQSFIISAALKEGQTFDQVEALFTYLTRLPADLAAVGFMAIIRAQRGAANQSMSSPVFQQFRQQNAVLMADLVMEA